MGGTKDITPAKVAEVSFNEQVEQVKTALGSRTAAKKTEREKWTALMSAFQKHGVSRPATRRPYEALQDRIDTCKIYEKPADPPAEAESLNSDVQYYISELIGYCSTEEMEVLEKRFPGLTDFGNAVRKHYRSKNTVRTDAEATKAAKKEMMKALDDWQTATDALTDISETVSDVKEYIGVVEKVANISATANKK